MDASVGVAPVARQPSRYRHARDGPAIAPDATRTVAASNDNPSIARSMSRYRRKRPGVGSSPVIPGVGLDPARAPPPVAVPGHARHKLSVDEERLRERHRLDAMEQLTGGNTNSCPSTRPSSAERTPRRAQTKEEIAPKVRTREATKERRPGSHPSNDTAERKSFFQKVGIGKSKSSPAKGQSAPKYIGVGGGGIVPGTDAPVSAVNAGERHVLVQYGNIALNFPFTPSTQVSDILLSASKTLSSEINPNTFVLVESFRQIGLDRPLRRYEHIRNIMNSWTHDSDSNCLTVIPPSNMDVSVGLAAQQVPADRPCGTTVTIYYSNRPRKWDKRFVTLRPDGQVTMAKKESAKDSTNICHLSDYDIYTPTARAAAKDIKPPKRFCFAIKSQQKSTMFLTTDNFVHFFSTSDQAIGDKWHRAVQQWRSWYLVNKLGATEPVEEATIPKKTVTQRRGSQRNSHESPLVDQIPGDESSPPVRYSAGSRPTSSKDLFSRKKSSREQTAPPTKPFPETLNINTRVDEYTEPVSLGAGMSPEEVEGETFSPTGLLGRSYTQRQQAMHERQEREKREKQEPWLYHSQTVNPDMPPLPQANGTLSRATSVNQKNKPLVDLTPVFHDPPQHTRKGRGITVGAGQQLIDGATGPDLAPGAVAIPAAQTWRRPPVPPVPPMPESSTMPTRSNTVRSTRHASQAKRPDTSFTNASPTSPDLFIPNTLLAQSSRRAVSYDQAPKGRGVATGDRNANRPMLDMSPENPFVEGSLLHQAS